MRPVHGVQTAFTFVQNAALKEGRSSWDSEIQSSESLFREGGRRKVLAACCKKISRQHESGAVRRLMVTHPIPVYRTEDGKERRNASNGTIRGV